MDFLEMKKISKVFGQTMANDSVDLTVEKGQIHALLGENGAGKSTLMNILYGMYPPDSGEIILRGERAVFSSPKDAINRGVGMVHQHFMLIPEQTVIENVILGMPGNPFVLDLKKQAEEFSRLAEQYNMQIDPWCRVESLSVGQQQRLEILKALYKKADFLILDEPTAVLTPGEVQELFKMMRKLTKEGCTILFISHKLPEIMEICSHCTILRQGKVVASMPISEISSQRQLASLMVGKAADLELKKRLVSPGREVLKVENLTYLQNNGVKAVDHVSLTVSEGEIVGICGVDGNGQSELIRCITGLYKPQSGKISICGEDCSGKSVKQILRKGVAHIPEDRLRMGVVQELSIRQNMVLMHYDQSPVCRHGIINWRAVSKRNQKICDDYQVKMSGQNQAVGELSGGNQQKLVVGRELDWDPKLIIAVHPSRGLDIGAAKYIQSSIIEARDKGAGVLLVSTELEEILEISDRIIVIFRGRIMADIKQEEAKRERIGMLMAGIE